MAIMSDPDRHETWAEFMRSPEVLETFALPKLDLRAAVDAIDQWLSDNGAALNAAIPQPARSALTTRQKARLLTLVIRRRYLSEV